MRTTKFRVLVAVLLILTLFSSCSLLDVLPKEENSGSNGLYVHFIDVGQADAALVLCGDDAMLIDGGNTADSDLIYAYLEENGITVLDYIVCTHPHEDHVGGLPAAFEKCHVDNVLSPVTEYNSDAFSKFVSAAEKQGLSITVPDPGMTFSLGDAQVTVLGPVHDYDDVNNTSIVLKIVYGDTSFIFMGDAENQAEHDIIESGANLESTVLKIGHHGSESSTSYLFLRSVMPSYAIISVGAGNSYGHPHEETLSRLRDAGVKLYRTDMQGTIIAHSDGVSVSFTAERNQNAITNPTENQTESYYIGNKNSMKFHRPSCSNLPDEKNQVILESYEEAIEKGYTPCGNCM